MKIRTGAIALALTAPAIVALAAPGTGGAASAAVANPTRVSAVAHQGATTPAQIRHVLAYWTPARRAAVKPFPLPRTVRPVAASVPQRTGPTVRVAPFGNRALQPLGAVNAPLASEGGWTGSQTSLPAKDIGVLAYTTPDGANWGCSASVVVAGNHDVILTAGHCVYNKSYVAKYGTGWSGNYVFYPGYNGTATNPAPYGAWTGRGAVTTSPWIGTGNLSYDYAFVLLNRNSAGQHIDDALGNALGVEWNAARGRTYRTFGYPADPAPYDGQHLDWCYSAATTVDGSPAENRVNCDMGHGSSGGPWLDSFSNGWGYANSVNSTSDFAGSRVRPVLRQFLPVDLELRRHPLSPTARRRRAQPRLGALAHGEGAQASSAQGWPEPRRLSREWPRRRRRRRVR